MRLVARIVGAALASSCFMGAASAQPTEPAVVERQSAPTAETRAAEGVALSTATVRVPMNTLIVFEIAVPLSSNTAKVDETFPIQLVEPIVIDGRIVAPRGTIGQGQVIQAAKSGWGGKAGELVVTVRYLDVGGVQVPLRRFRLGAPDTGKDRRDTAFVVSMAVPLGAFVVKGGEKTVPRGTIANAIIAADTEIPTPAGEPAPPTN